MELPNPSPMALDDSLVLTKTGNQLKDLVSPINDFKFNQSANKITPSKFKVVLADSLKQKISAIKDEPLYISDL